MGVINKILSGTRRFFSKRETRDSPAIAALERVLKFVDEQGGWDKLINPKWDHGFRLLLQFTNLNDEECVKLLLEHNVKVNGEPQPDYNLTPLQMAVRNRNIKIVKMLLDYGAEPNVSCKGTMEPIWLAVAHNTVEIFQLLKRYGADIHSGTSKNYDDKYGFFSYYCNFNLAVCNGYSEMVALLLEESNFDTNGTRIPINFYFCAIKRAKEKFPIISKKFKDITGRLIEHIIKVKSQNSDVSEENLLLLRDDEFILHVNKCEEEILRLKPKINDTDFSFYDILTKSDDALIRFVRNINVVSSFNAEKLKVEFPIYGKKIVCRFKKACRRKYLVEKCIPIFSRDFCYGSLGTLPFECIERIFRYLSDYELQKFIYKILAPLY
ncbi:POTE ankyrin domain family member B-like [Microplitis mediator]|uniref:POTE ankyrin domain family member B-like n=1 Tax=Microplitis mediator TaxID=375433 RepID=UPI002556B811|nr:POTE ankyrin domain family member B-like [Microplitis mediator]